MKKILTLCVLAALNLSAKHDEPKLILEYQYSNTKFLDQVKKLKIDSSFCCIFKVKFIKNKGNENITVIKHRKTGKELGIIYGTPTKEFISMVYETYFTDELVKDMIR
jgi:hypothetical protein